jgi:hypothetical protein
VDVTFAVLDGRLRDSINSRPSDENNQPVAEAGNEVEFSAEGVNEAAEGAELQVVLGLELGEGGLTDAHRPGHGGLGEAELRGNIPTEERNQ